MGEGKQGRSRSRIGPVTGKRPFTLGIAIPPNPPVADVYRALDLAETLGVEVCSTWDHLVEFTAAPEGAADDRPAPFEHQALLGALAARAVDVRIGVGVTEFIRRHPVIVAQSFITLAHLARHPPILGIGAGEQANTQPYGLRFASPVDRLEEGLQIVRDCLDGRVPLKIDGRAFDLRDAPFDLRPPAGRTPELWVGGRGPRMRALAGRFGDGWYPADLADPDTYAAGIASVQDAAGACGRDPDTVLPAGELVVYAVEDEAATPEVLRSDDARLTGLLLGADLWRAAGLSHPFGESSRGFVDHDPARVTRGVLASVPPELVARHVLAGTPRVIAERLVALRAAGMSHATLSFGAIRDAASAEIVGEVVHAIRDRTSGD